MTEEMKRFFNKIKDREDFFTLWRLYQDNKKDMEEADKLAILKWIEKDEYSEGSDLENTFLANNLLFSEFEEPFSLVSGLSTTVFNNLVCENRFLDILDHKLEEGTISGIPLDNALEILLFGISIKKGEIEPLELFVDHLGIDLVRDFDWKHAEKLVSDITILKIRKKKRNGTIISFQKYKNHKMRDE